MVSLIQGHYSILPLDKAKKIQNFMHDKSEVIKIRFDDL